MSWEKVGGSKIQKKTYIEVFEIVVARTVDNVAKVSQAEVLELVGGGADAVLVVLKGLLR